jgi:4-amino-4-deoxy-L-arabinose transferase-like glycosyltransferase
MNVINKDRWYSQYPPGHPFLLLLGLYIKAPWIINPLFGSFSLCLLFFIAKNCYRKKNVVYLSPIFFLLSPFFLFMSSSYMNHVPTMFFMLLFIYFYVKTLQELKWGHPLIAGLSLGYAMNIRPLTAFAMSLPFILDFTMYLCKGRKSFLKKYLLFSGGLCFMLTILLVYNYLTNGNPFIFGYQVKYDTLGFIGNAQMGPPHTLRGGFVNTSNNLVAMNKYLFEWPLPSLLFVFVFFLPRIEKNRWDWLFLFSSLLLVFSYFFYYFQDICFGPRFYFCSVPFLTLFTVRGLLNIPALLEKLSFDRQKVKASLILFILFCFAYTLFFSAPALYKKYSHFYFNVDDSLHKTVIQRRITNAIVFINITYPPGNPVPNLPVYGAGFQYNSPDLKDRVIYAIDWGEKDKELIQEYPGRNYYLWKFNPERGKFELMKIPLDKHE